MSKNVTNTLVDNVALNSLARSAGTVNLDTLKEMLIASEGSYGGNADKPYRVIDEKGDEIKLGNESQKKTPCRATLDLETHWDLARGLFLVIPNADAALKLQEWGGSKKQKWSLKHLTKTKPLDIAKYELTPAYTIGGSAELPNLTPSDVVFMEVFMLRNKVKIFDAVNKLLHACPLAKIIATPPNTNFDNRGILTHIAYVITWKSFTSDTNANSLKPIKDVWQTSKSQLQNGIQEGDALNDVVEQMVKAYSSMNMADKKQFEGDKAVVDNVINAWLAKPSSDNSGFPRRTCLDLVLSGLCTVWAGHCLFFRYRF